MFFGGDTGYYMGLIFEVIIADLFIVSVKKAYIYKRLIPFVLLSKMVQMYQVRKFLKF